MTCALDAPLGQLVAQAEQLRLLVDYRFIGGYLYLDVGGRRFVLDESMGRSFLLGMLAVRYPAGSSPADAA